MKAAERDRLVLVYRDHVDSVFAFFAASTPRHVAEDLTSATFERVLKSWKRFDPAKASERTWIFAIARNLLTDHYRRQRHRDAVSLDEYPLLAESLAARSSVDLALDRDEVRSWLAGLGERERMVLSLRYGADLTAREIGDMLDLKEANVHQILSRSLRKLRESVAQAWS